jgi:4'-phosphopantetheinyl transferase
MNRPLEIVVTPLDARALGRGAACLSSGERERAARLRFETDRRRFIASRAKLRELLAVRCGLPPESLQLEASGKPALAGSSLAISVSRSGALAAFAFARGRAVGIDIEALRPLDGCDAIAARTFCLSERSAYMAAKGKMAAFFRGWTRTEALAKALGGGLALAPEALEAALEAGWRVRSFAPAPGYAGAVAVSPKGSCQ